MLYVQEDYVNATKGYRFGGTDPYEAFTDNVGELYRRCRSEFGACQGGVYVDTRSDQKTHRIGWVFRKRMEYEDARPGDRDRFYLREVWVTVLEPCELDDPLASRRGTPLGEERIRFKPKYLE